MGFRCDKQRTKGHHESEGRNTAVGEAVVPMLQTKRFWLLATLALIGVVYAVVATRLWVMSWVPLLPLTTNNFILRLLFGPFWFAVQLIPITIAVTLLRLQAGYAVIAVVVYAIIMNVAQLTFLAGGGKSYTLPMIMAINTTLDLVLQLPVWWLTSLTTKVKRSVHA